MLDAKEGVVLAAVLAACALFLTGCGPVDPPIADARSCAVLGRRLVRPTEPPTDRPYCEVTTACGVVYLPTDPSLCPSTAP